MCLFCSFRSSFQNSACSFQKQRNCRYSNFPYFSGFLRCNRQKSLKYQAFRQIQSRLKPPSKITKQPLTYKTRNAVSRKASRVRIPNSPPKSPKNQGFSAFLFCSFAQNRLKTMERTACFFGKNKAILGILAYSNRKNQFSPSSAEISAHLLPKFTDSGSAIPLTIAFAEDSFEV